MDGCLLAPHLAECGDEPVSRFRSLRALATMQVPDEVRENRSNKDTEWLNRTECAHVDTLGSAIGEAAKRRFVWREL